MTDGSPQEVTSKQDKQPNARNPAQVAPAFYVPSASPHSRTEPQPDSHTALQSEKSKYKTSTQMATIVNTQNADPDLDTPALGVDSPKDTGAHAQLQLQTPSPPDIDLSVFSELQECFGMHAQLQENVPASQMAPVTLPPTQHQDTEMSMTPPATPSQDIRKDPLSSSALQCPISPITAITAPSSKWAASALARFQNQWRVAKHPRIEPPRIFEKTRCVMKCNSRTMFSYALRGFERGMLPTRQTRPPLLKRRYSVDVNTTENWGTHLTPNWEENEIEYDPHQLETFDLEPLPILTQWMFIPYPPRYAAFGTVFYLNPPFNDDVYLTLGDITIQNDAFCHIRCTNWSLGDPWMRDESLDMSLEVLCRDYDCDNHDIAIANSMISQICLFAAESEDSGPEEYSQYKDRFQDKRWIFLVVNDAIGSFQADCLQGNHWSLLAMDRIHRRTSYYDSLYLNDSQSRQRGLQISRGMLNILGEDPRIWGYQAQVHTPHQKYHNQFHHDDGACGPFVYKMTEMLIGHIKFYQSHHMEGECFLELSEDFPLYFRDQFHSLQVRHEIQRRIARWKSILDAPLMANNHDNSAISGQCVELNDSPVVHFEIPRRIGPRVHNSVVLKGENDARYEPNSDSSDSTNSHGSRLSETTAIFELSPYPQEVCADTEAHEQCEDGGVSIFGPECVEEYVPGGL